MDTMFRSVMGIVSLALCVSPTSGQDLGAGYASLFGHWNVARLVGGQPPVLGATATMTVYAPLPLGQAAVVLLSVTAGSGIELFTPSNRNFYYLDPATPPIAFLPVALTAGQAVVSLPVPNDPLLTGADMAAQAWVAGLSGFTASNLLLANLGPSSGDGMDFTLMQPVGEVVLRRAGMCADLFQNDNVRTVTVSITGTRSEDVTLSWALRDNSQAGSIPPQPGPFTLLVGGIAPGTGIDLCNYLSTSNISVVVTRLQVQ